MQRSLHLDAPRRAFIPWPSEVSPAPRWLRGATYEYEYLLVVGRKR